MYALCKQILCLCLWNFCLLHLKILPRSYFLFLNHIHSILVYYLCHFPPDLVYFSQTDSTCYFQSQHLRTLDEWPWSISLVWHSVRISVWEYRVVELRWRMHCSSLACSPINQLRFKNKPKLVLFFVSKCGFLQGHLENKLIKWAEINLDSLWTFW